MVRPESSIASAGVSDLKYSSSHGVPVFHPVECSYCRSESMMGFRYRCQQCHGYQLCQSCFWRGHANGPHSNQHQMKEHSSWVSWLISSCQLQCTDDSLTPCFPPVRPTEVSGQEAEPRHQQISRLRPHRRAAAPRVPGAGRKTAGAHPHRVSVSDALLVSARRKTWPICPLPAPRAPDLQPAPAM